MSTGVDDRIENDLRAAFRAAAAGVRPEHRPLPVGERRIGSTRRPDARRWLIPTVAAAVVAAIGVPLLVFSLLAGPGAPDIAAASAVTVSGGRATVAGVSFPVPEGWAAKTVASDATSVTVCVAATPSARCDGVTLRIAVPDGGGNITPVADPVTLACTDAGHPYPEIIDFAPLGGRPAVHYAIGCAATGPRSGGWAVTDGSLSITTPPGIAVAQGESIAAGVDFSRYQHAYGPQHMFFSGPGVASSSGGISSPAPFEGRTIDVDGVRIPTPEGWTGEITSRDGMSVTVCVAAAPTAGCDGVTVRFATGAQAIPQQQLFRQACDGHDSMWTDNGDTQIDGRDAGRYTGTCPAEGTDSSLWLLKDDSLAVWTPPGKYADLAATIVAGIDLRNWDHP